MTDGYEARAERRQRQVADLHRAREAFQASGFLSRNVFLMQQERGRIVLHYSNRKTGASFRLQRMRRRRSELCLSCSTRAGLSTTI